MKRTFLVSALGSGVIVSHLDSRIVIVGCFRKGLQVSPLGVPIPFAKVLRRIGVPVAGDGRKLSVARTMGRKGSSASVNGCIVKVTRLARVCHDDDPVLNCLELDKHRSVVCSWKALRSYSVGGHWRFPAASYASFTNLLGLMN